MGDKHARTQQWNHSPHHAPKSAKSETEKEKSITTATDGATTTTNNGSDDAVVPPHVEFGICPPDKGDVVLVDHGNNAVPHHGKVLEQPTMISGEPYIKIKWQIRGDIAVVKYKSVHPAYQENVLEKPKRANRMVIDRYSNSRGRTDWVEEYSRRSRVGRATRSEHCGICLQKLEGKCAYVKKCFERNKVHHCFHTCCINAWLRHGVRRTKKCPVCNTPMVL